MPVPNMSDLYVIFKCQYLKQKFGKENYLDKECMKAINLSVELFDMKKTMAQFYLLIKNGHKTTNMKKAYLAG